MLKGVRTVDRQESFEVDADVVRDGSPGCDSEIVGPGSLVNGGGELRRVHDGEGGAGLVQPLRTLGEDDVAQPLPRHLPVVGEHGAVEGHAVVPHCVTDDDVRVALNDGPLPDWVGPTAGSPRPGEGAAPLCAVHPAVELEDAAGDVAGGIRLVHLGRDFQCRVQVDFARIAGLDVQSVDRRAGGEADLVGFRVREGSDLVLRRRVPTTPVSVGGPLVVAHPVRPVVDDWRRDQPVLKLFEAGTKLQRSAALLLGFLALREEKLYCPCEALAKHTSSLPGGETLLRTCASRWLGRVKMCHPQPYISLTVSFAFGKCKSFFEIFPSGFFFSSSL